MSFFSSDPLVCLSGVLVWSEKRQEEEDKFLKLVSDIHVAQVIPHLFVGDHQIANDCESLTRNNITQVINCARECKDHWDDRKERPVCRNVEYNSSVVE